ncbi:MAG TPA: ABC-F family ATP-binding cassette domain-containing protein [Acidimicrobiales bacterium]|nr:ABC-F family ATP-binding cassette domain-containing protein [Acidimicrobiales bacterium]
MLSVRDLHVEVGGQTVVADASFAVAAGDKVGLVGRNGAGKTSLLRVLAGEDPAVAGELVRRGGVGYLPQEPRRRDEDTTALARVLSGRELDQVATRLEVLRQRMEEDPSEATLARFGRAEEAFAAADGYRAEAEGSRILAGLGLDAGRARLSLATLSGGERRRVELGRILFAGSDLLLLDEPTNHLDTDAKSWLMGFLRAYRGALVVVSHDLELLDEAITRVLHLDRAGEAGHLVEYRGTYTQYRRARRADEERQARIAQRRQAEINRLGTLADSMRHQTAKRARKAKTLDRRVERLRDDQPEGPARTRATVVRFPPPPRAGRVVLEVSGLAKGFGAGALFEGLSFDLGREERLLVMGLNGTGKTTLLGVLAGLVAPDTGTVRWGFGTSAGYYAQEHEGITPGRAVLPHLRERSDAPDTDLRALLGMLGLTGGVAGQDAGTLSGGEKTKLALAQLVAGRHNVLLLDEPTNNLDPQARDAVGASLAAWPGAMVLVSHDVAFVRALAPDRVLLLPDLTIDRWREDLSELVALA